MVLWYQRRLVYSIYFCLFAFRWPFWKNFLLAFRVLNALKFFLTAYGGNDFMH